MKNYEALFILKSDLSKDKTQELLTQINDTLTKNNVQVVSMNIWAEKRRLTFPIKKYREGNYYLLNFNSAPEAVSKINEDFKINENILRVLITSQMKPSLTR